MITMSQKIRFMIISGVSVSVIIALIWYNIGISSHLQDFKDRSNNLDRQLQIGASLPDNINSAISAYKARKAELESYKVPVAGSDNIIKLLKESGADHGLEIKDISLDRSDFFPPLNDRSKVEQIPIMRHKVKVQAVGNFLKIGPFLETVAIRTNRLRLMNCRFELDKNNAREVIANAEFYTYVMEPE